MTTAISPLSHMASCCVQAPSSAAFAYLADPVKLGCWALGCFDTVATTTPGLYSGRSLFDRERGWFRLDADAARQTIDYHTGTPDTLIHRISVRIMPGSALGYPANNCLVSLMAWRPADMTPDRWLRLCATHDAEIWLIKAQIENEPVLV